MAVNAPERPLRTDHVPDEDPEAVALRRDLAEARAILARLLEAEDRVGLVYPVIDDARRFLARTRR